jgi:hypothetical protein
MECIINIDREVEHLDKKSRQEQPSALYRAEFVDTPIFLLCQQFYNILAMNLMHNCG